MEPTNTTTKVEFKIEYFNASTDEWLTDIGSQLLGLNDQLRNYIRI